MNEGRNIGWVLERLPPDVHEVILVDGDSTDDTIAVASTVYPNIVVMRQKRRGKGAALRTGFTAATGEFVVMIDADGSMDPAEIGRYVEQLEAGYHLVKGSRFAKGGGTNDLTVVRRLGNGALRGTANLLFRTRFSELCYGFMAFRRENLLGLQLDADGFEIETQIVLRAVQAGLRIAEVPSYEGARRFGESNLNAWRDGRRVLRLLVEERFVASNGGHAASANGDRGKRGLPGRSASSLPAITRCEVVSAPELAERAPAR